MGKGLAVVLVAAALSALASMSFSRPSAPAPSAVLDQSGEHGDTDEAKRLRVELDELRGVVRQMQTARAQSVAPPAQPMSAQKDAPELSDEEMTRVNREKVRVHREFLTNRLETGRSDESWGDRTRQVLESEMAADKMLPGSALERVRCSADVCEARIVHEDPKAEEAFGLAGMYTMRGEAGEALTIRETEGDKLVSTVYFTRPGMLLPAPPPAEGDQG